MAHFRGTVQSRRGKVSRLGNKVSGLTVTAATQHAQIRVELWVHENGRDMVTIEWQPIDWADEMKRKSRVIHRGPLDDVPSIGVEQSMLTPKAG
jgi:hypothetical protein